LPAAGAPYAEGDCGGELLSARLDSVKREMLSGSRWSGPSSEMSAKSGESGGGGCGVPGVNARVREAAGHFKGVKGGDEGPSDSGEVQVVMTSRWEGGSEQGRLEEGVVRLSAR
jgi:hypothetical protein